ncbi:MAG: DNA-directed RNA polymerase subunit beta [bacterium]
MKEPKTNSAGRYNLGSIEPLIKLPNLIEAQKKSFEKFLHNGMTILFDEITPVKDTLGRMWTLEFGKSRYGKPNRTPDEAVDKKLSYDAPLYVTFRLTNERTGEIKEEEIFVADFPMMTEIGTFVFNGVTKVVVHQIVRAEGVLFDECKYKAPDRTLYSSRLMPTRGPWFEFEVNKNDVIVIRLVNKRPKILVTTLLRVLGFSSDDDIKNLFKDVMGVEHDLVASTLEKDSTINREQAIIDIYNKIRPDESVTLESAEKYIKGFFFDTRRFDLGEIGRYQTNKKLGSKYEMKLENYRLFVEDIVSIIKALVEVNNGIKQPDDIDSLANRRVRSVGEIMVDELRVGVRRMEKTIKDRMSMHGEDEKITPSMLISTKPISAAINSMFGTGQFSRFMDQNNILSELSNKREVTASGPGGLTKERATFSVRDVHFSHYSRFCPVQTPEGQPVGLVVQLSLYARINDYGFIEAPFVKVLQKAKNTKTGLIGRIPLVEVKTERGKVLAKAGKVIDEKTADEINKVKSIKEIDVRSYRSDEIVYIDSADELEHVATMSTVNMDEYGNIKEKLVSVRADGHFFIRPSQDVDLMDVIPSQMCGLSLASIPCVPNDYSYRAMMASNMQKQCVPLVKNEAAIVGTGYEEEIGRQSGWAVYAEEDGVVDYVDGKKVVVKYKGVGEPKEYEIVSFFGTNQGTCYVQKPAVTVGQKVKKDDLLVDGPSMQNGELALGTNILAAYMFFEGYVYEDGFLISERLIQDDILTSVHIKKYEHEIQETDLGPQIMTNDIPNVSERALRNLDERGVIRIGSRVQSQDVLVGTISPKGEQELTSEERLLRAIFGEHARDVRDVSLKLPHGQSGVVIRTQELSAEDGDKLSSGVIRQLNVWVAQTKKISYGDKLAGRHGDKGTIAGILPVEDMPFTEDGTPIDIVMNPNMVKRMNIGQLWEVRLAKLADELGIKIAVPNFEDLNIKWLYNQCEKSGLDTEERVTLFDGRTGKKFPRKIKVGPKYTGKLEHIASAKIHARSTGPYTLVTQQPLGGKAQMGGQRFGEMEVWALEAHGVPNTLQEILTIKSDDMKGRADAYKAIIHGEKVESVSTPESFKVLIKELNALGLNIDLIYQEKEEDGAGEEPVPSKEEEK